jgi:tetratricopeptide (TPR) repeat protein
MSSWVMTNLSRCPPELTAYLKRYKMKPLIPKKERIFMLKKMLLIGFIFSAQILFAQTGAFEELGDKFYDMRNNLKDGKPEINNIEKAIYNYQRILEKDPKNERVVYKYIKAIDFKCSYFMESEDERRKTYKDLIPSLEEDYKTNKKSPYLNYCLALTWGRYGELINIFKAARSGIAGKIKKYAENLYVIDREFRERAAEIILGRLYYKAPKIPFILTWPNPEKSKEYLEKVVEKYRFSLRAKFYLADTLYKLNEIEEAKGYYREVKTAAPRKEYFLEDSKAQEECIERIKSLGIKLE